MERRSNALKLMLSSGAAVLLLAMPIGATAFAAAVHVTGGAAAGQKGDGSMGVAAYRAMTHGALPASDADVAAKAAADSAAEAALKNMPAAASSAADAAAGGAASAPQAPIVSLGFEGQSFTG